MEWQNPSGRRGKERLVAIAELDIKGRVHEWHLLPLAVQCTHMAVLDTQRFVLIGQKPSRNPAQELQAYLIEFQNMTNITRTPIRYQLNRYECLTDMIASDSNKVLVLSESLDSGPHAQLRLLELTLSVGNVKELSVVSGIQGSITKSDGDFLSLSYCVLNTDDEMDDISWEGRVRIFRYPNMKRIFDFSLDCSKTESTVGSLPVFCNNDWKIVGALIDTNGLMEYCQTLSSHDFEDIHRQYSVNARQYLLAQEYEEVASSDPTTGSDIRKRTRLLIIRRKTEKGVKKQGRDQERGRKGPVL